MFYYIISIILWVACIIMDINSIIEIKVNASKGEKMDVKKGSQGKTLFTMFGK